MKLSNGCQNCVELKPKVGKFEDATANILKMLQGSNEFLNKIEDKSSDESIKDPE